MAPSSRTINYDAVLSLCLENIRPGLFDNIFTSSSFLSALYGKYGKKKKQDKGIKLINGGERIRATLMYGKNSTAKSYHGYDVLDVTPQDGITAAFYDWRQVAVSIAISRLEERQNAGESKIRDLLQAKTEQAQMSLFEEINYQILGKTLSSTTWVAGNGMSSGSDIDPLPRLIPKDPTASVTVGNINQNTYSWWRPKVVDGSAANAGKDSGAERGFLCTSWANLFAAMRYTYNACGKASGGFPDTLLCDQLTFESYEAGLDNRMRITSMDGPQSAGFESIRFKAADMIWDEFVPDMDTPAVYGGSGTTAGSMFFLNMDFLELVMDSATDFITTPFVRPENQDAKVAQILGMMNLTCTNRRKLGLIYGITNPITA